MTKLQQMEDNWKRALADYQNLVRRAEQDRTQYVKLANVNLLAKLVPALDIIELAASHNQDLGVQMAAKQFADVLNSEGVQPIVPKAGDIFDSTFHDCIETVDLVDDKQPDTISELVLKGYLLGDFVLRPARVKVYKAKLALDN
jgi:molecular chaperone GrpE